MTRGWKIDDKFQRDMNEYMLGGLNGEQPLAENDGRHKISLELRAAMSRGWAPEGAPMFIHPDGSVVHRRRENP